MIDAEDEARYSPWTLEAEVSSMYTVFRQFDDVYLYCERRELKSGYDSNCAKSLQHC